MNDPTPPQLERLQEIALFVEREHSAMRIRAGILPALLTVWREAQEGSLHDQLTKLLVAAEGDDLIEVVRNIIQQRDAALTWTNEDPRMLREQIRVSDLAFQNEFDMRTESNKLVQQLEASLKLAVENLAKAFYLIPDSYSDCGQYQTLKEALSTIRTNHPSVFPEVEK